MRIKKAVLIYLRGLTDNDNGGMMRGYFKRIVTRLRFPYFKIRYSPIIAYFRNHRIKEPSILEVGSGSLGVTLFLRAKATGLDLNFSGPDLGYLRMVKGDCRTLPFKDSAFDYVICMDMLEHINAQERIQAISGILRVAKKAAFIGFPTGRNAEAAEQDIRDIYEEKIKNWKKTEEEKKDFIKRSLFLLEHKEHELPDTDAVLEELRPALKKYDWDPAIMVLKNDSVKMWHYLVLNRMELNFRFFIISFMINLLPYSLFNTGWGGFYRNIFIVEKQKS